MPTTTHKPPTVEVLAAHVSESPSLEICDSSGPGPADIPDSLFAFLELHAPTCTEVRAQTTRTTDEKRNRWRNAGHALRCEQNTDPNLLAQGLAELARHLSAEPDLDRVRIVARCEDAPRRRYSGHYVLGSMGFEEPERGHRGSASGRDDYNDIRTHARADSRAMMAIVIESAQAVQSMTATMGEALAKIWETQASNARSHNEAFAQVEIAKLEHAARAQELAADSARTDRLLGVLGQVAPAIAAHVKTGGDPGATVRAMQPAPETQDAPAVTHGPTTSQLCAILAELGDDGIATLARVAGEALWSPLWAAVSDDSDPEAQEVAVVASLRAIRAHVEGMEAADKTAALGELMTLGAPALALHGLISKA